VLRCDWSHAFAPNGPIVKTLVFAQLTTSRRATEQLVYVANAIATNLTVTLPQAGVYSVFVELQTAVGALRSPIQVVDTAAGVVVITTGSFDL
jgi:hypothetical protein